jgi:hypothetical protein
MSTIQPSEVQWFLSNPTAVTGFSGTGAPGNSLGKYLSTTQINVSTTLDNLFLDATGQMNAAQEVDYQCLFLCNNTATGFTMKNPVVWMPTPFVENTNSTTQVGSDPIGVVAQNASSAQAQLISAQSVAPAGVTNFVFPSASMSQGLAVPDIPPANCIAIWVKRSLNNLGPTPVSTPDGVAITVSFQSNA